MDSLVVAIAFAIGSAIAVIAYDLGRSSVAIDCESYGKARINRVLFVCSK